MLAGKFVRQCGYQRAVTGGCHWSQRCHRTHMKLPTILLVFAGVIAALVFISCKRSEQTFAPPHVADTNKVAVLLSLRIAQSREHWVSRYLEHYPDAHPLAIIGDYNSDWDFTKRWQPFSLSQMQSLVESRKGKTK